MYHPLVYLTIAYASGIASGKLFPISFLVLCLAIILIFIACILFLRIKKSIVPILIAILVFFLGMASYQFRSSIPPDDISRFVDKKVSVIGVIDDEPVLSGACFRFNLKAQKMKANNYLKNVSGKVRVSTGASKIRLKYGDRIRIKGKLSKFTDLANPGLSSYSDYLEARGIRCKLFSYNLEPKILSRGHGNLAVTLGIYLQHKFKHVIQTTLQKPYSTLLGSIVLGSRASPPPPELKEAYKKVGVVHLLVASGMHLMILMGVCLGLCKFFRVSLTPSIVSASVVGLLYTLVTGAGPSIVRAFIMAEITLLALLIEREKDIYIALAFAALCLLVINPANLFEIGFQLSFAATWSLLYIGPVLQEKFNAFLPRFFSTLFSASTAPVLATSPITIYYFSHLSIVAILTNILVLPWIGTLLSLGFVSTTLGIFFLPLASILNGTVFLMLKVLNFIVSTLSSLPFASASIVPPTPALVFGYYAGLIALTEFLRRGREFKLTKKKLVVVTLFVVAVFVWNSAFTGQSSSKDLILTMIDVGQGDSILIESPAGISMLVDGGGSGRSKNIDHIGAKIVVPVLKRKGINKLDLVVLTHPHDDHVGGIPEVLKAIKVDLILDPKLSNNSPAYTRFVRLIKEKEISWRLARGGQVINLGKGIRGYILAPSDPLLEDTNSDLNNNSVVIRLVYGKIAILLTGDLEEEGEERLLKLSAFLQSNILKVGHHGSGGASSKEFLAAVMPEISLISCGVRNKFGHPHKSALKRLSDQKIRVYRTDLHGAIVIRTDGERIRIKTMKEPN